MGLAPHIRKRLAEEAAAAAVAASATNTCSAGNLQTTSSADEHEFPTPTVGASAPTTNNSAIIPSPSQTSVSVPRSNTLTSSNVVAAASSARASTPWQASRTQAMANAPTEILCWGCDKIKQKEEFSPTQLKRLEEKIRNNPHFDAASSAQISCVVCNTGPTETECFLCGVTKARAHFNDTQWSKRAHGDDGEAVCNLCMQERHDAELQDFWDEDIPQTSESEDDGDGGAPLAAIQSVESDGVESDCSDYDSDDSMYKLKL